MEGGCHCGHIRYVLSALPFATDFCHCRDCQRTTGAPVGAWMDFHTLEVNWLKGAPTEYASSDKVRRGFCPNCGATLSYRSLEYPDYLTLSITSLDHPEEVRPTYHIHTDRQLSWMPIADTFPRYSKGKS
ncbi:GFA family protein [Aeromonas hydrophila]|uniref:GFA family protein n=1 Tax=Aeromonas hydrophila TaxID=644 RepID=UPI001C73F010|nr:GFA family protein [Aeromonas hydrophila]MCR3911324.1 GFA family protein [Aeromonas hydrophila]QWL69770.1 GFA family protein [Aeromonas hydrophila]